MIKGAMTEGVICPVPSETTVLTKLKVLCDPMVIRVLVQVIPRRLKPPWPINVSESKSTSDFMVMVIAALATKTETTVGEVVTDDTCRENVLRRNARMDPFDTLTDGKTTPTARQLLQTTVD